jgi:hypothetical protein
VRLCFGLKRDTENLRCWAKIFSFFFRAPRFLYCKLTKWFTKIEYTMKDRKQELESVAWNWIIRAFLV